MAIFGLPWTRPAPESRPASQGGGPRGGLRKGYLRGLPVWAGYGHIWPYPAYPIIYLLIATCKHVATQGYRPETPDDNHAKYR